jgi:Type I restriction modification DNA specificity domain
MITNIISIEQMHTSSRWNAEFFIDVDNKLLKSINYEIKKIGDLVEERKEFLLPADYSNQLFNYIGLENISQNNRSLISFEPKLGSEVKSRCKIYREGDILYGRLRPNLNKVLLINNEPFEGICSTEIFVLVPNLDLIDPDYLSEILISRIVLDRVGNITAGSALPRVQIKDFFALEVPVLPLKQQKMIAENALKLRMEAEQMLAKANNILSMLPNSFVEGVELGKKYIEISESNSTMKIFENPLPQGEFSVRTRK